MRLDVGRPRRNLLHERHVSSQIELTDNRPKGDRAFDVLRDEVNSGVPVELRVETASMSGAIEPGDFVSLIPGRDAKAGEIVAFPLDGMLCVHRIIGARERQGGKEFITKGDRSHVRDCPVPAGMIVGKVHTVIRRTHPRPDASRRYQFTARALSLAAEFARIRSALNEGSIHCIPLKGVSLYLQKLIDPSSRYIGDMDILVRLEDVPSALKTFESLGYAAPRQHVRLKESAYLNSVSLCRGDFVAHLHWHLLNTTLPLFMYRIDMQKVWNDTSRKLPAGDSPLFLSPEHELIHLAVHAFNHSYEKPSLIDDCVSALDAFMPRITLEKLVDDTRAWNCGLAMYCLIRICESLTGKGFGCETSLFLKDARMRAKADDFVSRVVSRGRGRHNEVFGLDCALAGGFRRLIFLFLTVFPPADVMQSIYASYGDVPLFMLYARRIWGNRKFSIGRESRRALPR